MCTQEAASDEATLQPPSETYSCLLQIVWLLSPIAQISTLRSRGLTQGHVLLTQLDSPKGSRGP